MQREDPLHGFRRIENVSDCTHDCSSCGQDCADRETQSLQKAPNAGSNIRHVIGVVSGKGGVGKSLVTSLLAAAMRKKGYKTAVLDADITGPSIPKIFGVSDPAVGVEGGILPVTSAAGTKIMSLNLLLEDENMPVVWRGPVIANVVTQFWTDVIWGDVDYMFVDMPPGTGDVPLTVFQSLPVEGIIVVTSPQELVSMIVSKAVNMARMMNVPVMALVENMSYLKCPDCGKEIPVFGDSHVAEEADKHGIVNYAKIPIEPQLPQYCDSGTLELFDQNWLDGVLHTIETCCPIV